MCALELEGGMCNVVCRYSAVEVGTEFTFSKVCD